MGMESTKKEAPSWMENTKCAWCQTGMVRRGMDQDRKGPIKLMVCPVCGHKQRVRL